MIIEPEHKKPKTFETAPFPIPEDVSGINRLIHESGRKALELCEEPEERGRSVVIDKMGKDRVVRLTYAIAREVHGRIKEGVFVADADASRHLKLVSGVLGGRNRKGEPRRTLRFH